MGALADFRALAVRPPRMAVGSAAGTQAPVGAPVRGRGVLLRAPAARALHGRDGARLDPARAGGGPAFLIAPRGAGANCPPRAPVAQHETTGAGEHPRSPSTDATSDAPTTPYH